MLKIINGGIQTLVEDWPGRIGYLNQGISPSGAFDHFAHRAANLIVGNPVTEATLEIAAGLFEAEFGIDTVISITGSDMKPTINDQPTPMWESIRVNKGDKIRFKRFGELGFRAYLGIDGGIDVPLYLGSKSTCIYGSYGGFEGRRLQRGDELKLIKPTKGLKDIESRKFKKELIPEYSITWEIRVLAGMSSAPDYFTEEGMDWFFSEPRLILKEADRSAYRLEVDREEMRKTYARENGGQGGSHPTNIVDHAYILPGAINTCGDAIIILNPDGPTAGGYTCPFAVIYADMWKVGQGAPVRDYIKFTCVTPEEAIEARIEQDKLFTEQAIQIRR